jgi:hypothetical protein
MPCGVWTTTDIPQAKVNGVIAGYMLDTPQSVVSTQQADGSWTVTATFPPCVPPKAERSEVFSE